VSSFLLGGVALGVAAILFEGLCTVVIVGEDGFEDLRQWLWGTVSLFVDRTDIMERISHYLLARRLVASPQCRGRRIVDVVCVCTSSG